MYPFHTALMKQKKINCFIYFALAKHGSAIKLGEFTSDQKYFAR